MIQSIFFEPILCTILVVGIERKEKKNLYFQGTYNLVGKADIEIDK